ncbi:MAG: hypothetical protein RLZZ244_2351 [Verrucomicrobiota bacterium]|jgi:predicted metalloendopeptidase
MLRALRLLALCLLLLALLIFALLIFALRSCAPSKFPSARPTFFSDYRFRLSAQSPSTPLPPPPPSFSLDFLDRSVDPGSDFYRFACGSWLKKTSIPEDDTSWSPTAELVRRNTSLLGGLLLALLKKRLVQSASLTPPQKQLADFYAAALDQQRIDALGITPLQHDLEKIEALHSLEALASLLAEFHTKGIAACFELSVASDERQSDRYALSLSQGGLGLPDRDYYFAARFAKERRAYPAHLQRVLTLIGRPPTTLPEEIRAIVSLETALAKASRKMEDLSDPIANYHKISRAELARLTPSFPWETYWRTAQPAPFESLIVGQPEFFKAWEKELQKRPLSTWKAYLRWKLLETYAPHLHQDLGQAHFAFYGTLLEGQPTKNSSEHVFSSLSACLGESLGQLYVENAFPAHAREKVLALVDTLRATYQDQLANASWMSAETRREALEKLSRLRVKIGSPTTPRDYSAIEIRAFDHLGNLQRCAQAKWKRAMQRIGGPVDRDEWPANADEVNAYFLPTENEIVFPAGILQPPFFDPTMDDAVNFGSIGATIGHELTHGYDNEGRRYDAQGNLRDWWTPSDARAFEARAQKLVSQFNRFTPLPKLHVNGKLTLSENIADLNGLRIAFDALQRVLDAHPEKRQPIDGFSPEQRFFLAYAQRWAAKIRPAALRASLSTDAHAPDTLRGFAPLLHLQEFYDAFHIPPSAPLYLPPAKRTSFQ